MRIVLASFASLAVAATLVISFVGCEASPAPAQISPAASTSNTDIPEDLAALSDADRNAALAQRICPVSGEPLGSMGTPPKVVVDGREVYLCCASCESPLRAEPEKHLAKLDE